MKAQKGNSVYADSLFASDVVVERKVKLGDGKEHSIYLKEAPAVEFRRFQISESSEDPAVRVTSMFALVASSVVEPDGRPAMDVERAKTLRTPVLNAIVREIIAINSASDEAKKPLPPEANRGSGTR